MDCVVNLVWISLQIHAKYSVDWSIYCYPTARCSSWSSESLSDWLLCTNVSSLSLLSTACSKQLRGYCFIHIRQCNKSYLKKFSFSLFLSRLCLEPAWHFSGGSVSNIFFYTCRTLDFGHLAQSGLPFSSPFGRSYYSTYFFDFWLHFGKNSHFVFFHNSQPTTYNSSCMIFLYFSDDRGNWSVNFKQFF